MLNSEILTLYLFISLMVGVLDYEISVQYYKRGLTEFVKYIILNLMFSYLTILGWTVTGLLNLIKRKRRKK